MLAVKAIGCWGWRWDRDVFKDLRHQRTLFDRLWTRHHLRDLSVLGPAPSNLLGLHASGRGRGVETAEELIETERFCDPHPDVRSSLIAPAVVMDGWRWWGGLGGGNLGAEKFRAGGRGRMRGCQDVVEDVDSRPGFSIQNWRREKFIFLIARRRPRAYRRTL